MPVRVLWLDDDLRYLKPYSEALEDAGFSVSVTRSPLEAEKLLAESSYDVLILDVMIPTLTPEEEIIYDPLKTGLGFKTGLVFFRRTKELLVAARTTTLVLTVRLDMEIAQEFIDEGLEASNFSTKLALKDVSDFKQRIDQLLE